MSSLSRSPAERSHLNRYLLSNNHHTIRTEKSYSVISAHSDINDNNNNNNNSHDNNNNKINHHYYSNNNNNNNNNQLSPSQSESEEEEEEDDHQSKINQKYNNKTLNNNNNINNNNALNNSNNIPNNNNNINRMDNRGVTIPGRSNRTQSSSTGLNNNNNNNNNNSGGGGGGGGGVSGGSVVLDDDNDIDVNADLGSGSGTSSDFQSEDDDYAWIPWFCSLKGNEFFCEVEESYVQDSFNLTGLQQLVPYFDQALDMILDIEPTEVLSDDQQEMIENDAETLFGLIHARYILTSKGLQAMYDKYRSSHFGQCPRALCKNQPVLPCGLSDIPNEDSVKLYCPRCEDVYTTRSSRHEHIDGAYFGTTFPHLFFLTYPELKSTKSKISFIPRVFGFRLNKDCYKKSLDAKKKQSKVAKGGGTGTPIQGSINNNNNNNNQGGLSSTIGGNRARTPEFNDADNNNNNNNTEITNNNIRRKERGGGGGGGGGKRLSSGKKDSDE